MRRVYAVLLFVASLGGCASRTKQPVKLASVSAQPARAAPSGAARCEVPCEQASKGPNVHVVLALRSSAPASVEPPLEAALSPLARELEKLRAELLACNVDPRPVVALSAQAGSLSVEFRGRELPETEAACLRDVLKGGVTPALVQGEVAVGLPDQPLPVSAPGLTKEQIRGVVREHVREFRDCLLEHVEPSLYEARALHYPVRFRVDSTGEVRCVEPQNHDPALAAFACCFVPQLRWWRFPAFAGHGQIDVNYPFVVESAPQP